MLKYKSLWHAVLVKYLLMLSICGVVCLGFTDKENLKIRIITFVGWYVLGKIYVKTKKKVLKFFRGFLYPGVWPPKFDWAIKNWKFNFFVEYPTWVFIKRYLTGKLALACQNLIYCIRLKENVQWMVFGRFCLNGGSKSNSDKLAPTYPSNTSW